MRSIMLTLATLGLVVLGATSAFGAERVSNVATVSHPTFGADHAAITPVRWRVYEPAPGWSAYYGPAPYYSYRPHYRWYSPPRYYDYYYGVSPYAGYGVYYSPYRVGSVYWGPRRIY